MTQTSSSLWVRMGAVRVLQVRLRTRVKSLPLKMLLDQPMTLTTLLFNCFSMLFVSILFPSTIITISNSVCNHTYLNLYYRVARKNAETVLDGQKLLSGSTCIVEWRGRGLMRNDVPLHIERMESKVLMVARQERGLVLPSDIQGRIKPQQLSSLARRKL